MSALGDRIEGARVLDLFAGSGALGLEALSRGADSVVFVERARSTGEILRANVDLLGATAQCRVVEKDVFRFLDSNRERFDLAFADPPYAKGAAQRLVGEFVRDPFARELWLEHPWRETLELPGVTRTRRYGDAALTTLTAPS